MSDSRENKTNCFPRDLTLRVYNSRFSNVITSVTPKPKNGRVLKRVLKLLIKI